MVLPAKQRTRRPMALATATEREAPILSSKVTEQELETLIESLADYFALSILLGARFTIWDKD